MRLTNIIRDFDIFSLFETVLPDFILAFTFFTALNYAVLSKRFGQQRPAAAVSASLGLALAAASAFSIVGARYAYWVEARLGTRRSFLLVTGLPGVLYLVMAAAVYPPLTVLVFCALYASTSFKDPIISGHLNRHIESKNRATVLSLISMLSGLYVALMLFLRSMIGFYGSLLLALGLLLVGPTISLITMPPNYVSMICTGGISGMIVLLTLASQPGFENSSHHDNVVSQTKSPAKYAR